MAKTVNIEETVPHRLSEVICVNCKHRWLSVRPTQTMLKHLECPSCHKQGYVIETGEELPDDVFP